MNRSLFHLWQPKSTKFGATHRSLKNFNLNFGPQHPAAHGVLRLLLQLNEEIVEKIDPHIGLLHRGSEKLIETKSFYQNIPYFDRFDYGSMVIQEHAYVLGLETLMGSKNFFSSFSQIRTLFDELTRIGNHLISLATHALDVGSMSSVFWAFEEREKIMEFYERITGARIHAAFYKPNEINWHFFSYFFFEDLIEFCTNFFLTLNEMHNALTYNKIWKQRLINIGTYSYKTCLNYGITGVLARAVGLKRDLRLSKLETYGNYYYLQFRSYIGQHGDSYDRFLIRMNEMSEAVHIILQILNNLTKKILTATDKQSENLKNIFLFPQNILYYLLYSKKKLQNFKKSYNSMETLINHFKLWGEGIFLDSNITYCGVESSKGEFGVTLISDNSNLPYKCKIRSSSLHNLQFLERIGVGHFLADIVTLIGTIDVVFGEVDR